MSSVVGSVHGYAVGGEIARMPSAQLDNIVSFTVSTVEKPLPVFQAGLDKRFSFSKMDGKLA